MGKSGVPCGVLAEGGLPVWLPTFAVDCAVSHKPLLGALVFKTVEMPSMVSRRVLEQLSF